ncbi:guanylate kinase [Phycisphaerales bacterium AB-hyl4]|uniref:Guanylate kinase n=1 Tax=Natronomicrosphaera hydrolytica TaxID=3242702 RepID=A0ABV4U148_9BACT
MTDQPTNAPTPTGMLLIISGPSGVGKTTITRAVERQLDTVFSVSNTTRPKTADDVDGVDYHFVTREEFEREREAGELLEWAEVFGNCYGTPRKPVEENLAKGRVVLLEIDVQGAIQVKDNLPEAFAMFVLPPSEEVLLNRLRSRKREDESAIQRRFAKARHEIRTARESGAYDTFLVNDDLEKAVAEAVRTIRDELARRASS